MPKEKRMQKGISPRQIGTTIFLCPKRDSHHFTNHTQIWFMILRCQLHLRTFYLFFKTSGTLWETQFSQLQTPSPGATTCPSTFPAMSKFACHTPRTTAPSARSAVCPSTTAPNTFAPPHPGCATGCTPHSASGEPPCPTCWVLLVLWCFVFNPHRRPPYSEFLS